METDKLVDFDHVTDYISREAAKQRIRDSFSDLAHRCEINAILNSIPAADVVEVVRCKDCRYLHDGYDGYDEKCCINPKGVVATDENGFCHYAERRADNGK